MKVGSSAVIALLVNFAIALSHIKRQSSSTDRDSDLINSRSTYLGRKWFGSIVVGNYLYIDGGEIYYGNGSSDQQHLPAKSTYSIDLTTSWTNATVQMTRIDKAIDGRSLNWPLLWPGRDNSSFYAYDGEVYGSCCPYPTIPNNKLYKFRSDGSGKGSWADDQESDTASSNFADLIRVSHSAGVCARDVCYAVGGQRNVRVDPTVDSKDIAPASGVVSYNFTSRTWRNDSMIGDVFHGPWSGGRIFYTDVAGQDGILVALGGTLYSPAMNNGLDLSYAYVYIYDLATRRWYEQITGGDVPTATRDANCAVGVTGSDGANRTYEIFIHGGIARGGQNTQLDDVWVLSMPSFQWHRAGHTPVAARAGGHCSVIGHRQMAIIGGSNPDTATNNGKNITKDIWPLGLGVFDLSEMVFKDRYDASAQPYESPQRVKQWYSDNDRIWSNVTNEVRVLFESAANTTQDANPPAGGAKKNSSHAGTIAGGVLGGLIALVAIVAGVWYCVRDHRKGRQKRVSYPADKPELSDKQVYEKEALGHQPVEIGRNVWHERRQELE